MAGRIRSIKPELREHAAFAALTDGAARLFIMAFTLADDTGRCPAGPRFLAGAVFFGRQRSERLVASYLAELADAKLVTLYESDGPHLEIVGWREKGSVVHQRIEKPQPARYPAPKAIGSRNVPGTVVEYSGTDLDLRPQTRTTDLDLDLGQDPERDHDETQTTTLPSLEASGPSIVRVLPFAQDEHGARSVLRTSSRRKGKVCIPGDWSPSDAAIAAARHVGLDPVREAERFRNHALTNDRRCADWDAAFRNWLDKAEEFARSKQSPTVGRAEPANADQHALDAAKGGSPWS